MKPWYDCAEHERRAGYTVQPATLVLELFDRTIYLAHDVAFTAGADGDICTSNRHCDNERVCESDVGPGRCRPAMHYWVSTDGSGYTVRRGSLPHQWVVEMPSGSTVVFESWSPRREATIGFSPSRRLAYAGYTAKMVGDQKDDDGNPFLYPGVMPGAIDEPGNASKYARVYARPTIIRPPSQSGVPKNGTWPRLEEVYDEGTSIFLRYEDMASASPSNNVWSELDAEACNGLFVGGSSDPLYAPCVNVDPDGPSGTTPTDQSSLFRQWQQAQLLTSVVVGYNDSGAERFRVVDGFHFRYALDTAPADANNPERLYYTMRRVDRIDLNTATRGGVSYASYNHNTFEPSAVPNGIGRQLLLAAQEWCMGGLSAGCWVQSYDYSFGAGARHLITQVKSPVFDAGAQDAFWPKPVESFTLGTLYDGLEGFERPNTVVEHASDGVRAVAGGGGQWSPNNIGGWNISWEVNHDNVVTNTDSKGRPVTCSSQVCGSDPNASNEYAEAVFGDDPNSNARTTLGLSRKRDKFGKDHVYLHDAYGRLTYDFELDNSDVDVVPNGEWDQINLSAIPGGGLFRGERLLRARKFYYVVPMPNAFGYNQVRAVVELAPGQPQEAASLRFPSSVSDCIDGNWAETDDVGLRLSPVCEFSDGSQVAYNVTRFSYVENDAENLQNPNTAPRGAVRSVERAFVDDNYSPVAGDRSDFEYDAFGRLSQTFVVDGDTRDVRRRTVFEYFDLLTAPNDDAMRLKSTSVFEFGSTNPTFVTEVCKRPGSDVHYDEWGDAECTVTKRGGERTPYRIRERTVSPDGGIRISSRIAKNLNNTTNGLEYFTDVTGAGTVWRRGQIGGNSTLLDTHSSDATQGLRPNRILTLTSDDAVRSEREFLYNSFGEVISDGLRNDIGEQRQLTDYAEIDNDSSKTVRYVDVGEWLETEYHYDPNTKLMEEVINASGVSTRFEYGQTKDGGAIGRVIREIAAGQPKEYKYDGWGRVEQMEIRDLETILPVGQWTYDTAGRITSETIPTAGQQTTYGYRSDGLVSEKRIVSTVDATLVAHLKYEYDGLGRMLSVCDALASDCDSSPIYEKLLRYDAKDPNVIGVWQAEREIELSDTAQVGQLASAQDRFGVTHYEYDKLGRVVSVVRQHGMMFDPINLKAVSYRFGDVGQLRRVIYPSGTEVVYKYDADRERPTTVRVKPSGDSGERYTVIRDIEYEPYGTVRAAGRNKKYERAVERDMLGRVTSINTKYKAVDDIGPLLYSYEQETTTTNHAFQVTDQGSLTQLSEGSAVGVSRTFGRTFDRELLSTWYSPDASDAADSYSVSFDAATLRRSTIRRDGGAEAVYGYPARTPSQPWERVLGLTGGIDIDQWSLSYGEGSGDQAGRVMSIDRGADGTVDAQLSYGPEGNLRGAAIGAEAWVYEHDVQMRRVRKRLVGDVEQTFSYGTGRAVLEDVLATTDGRLRAEEFIYLAGERIASVYRDESIPEDHVVIDLHTDRMGVVRKATMRDGTHLARLVMTPWGDGAVLRDGVGDGMPRPTMEYRNAGQHADVETGLIENGYRALLPETGGYTSPEPLYGLSNLTGTKGRAPRVYAYAAQRPFDFSDSDGRVIVPEDDAGAALVAELASSHPDAKGLLAFLHESEISYHIWGDATFWPDREECGDASVVGQTGNYLDDFGEGYEWLDSDANIHIGIRVDSTKVRRTAGGGVEPAIVLGHELIHAGVYDMSVNGVEPDGNIQGFATLGSTPDTPFPSTADTTGRGNEAYGLVHLTMSPWVRNNWFWAR